MRLPTRGATRPPMEPARRAWQHVRRVPWPAPARSPDDQATRARCRLLAIKVGTTRQGDPAARRGVLSAAGCPWHYQAGHALRGDPPRLIDHLVNDITCRFDLADQAHTLTPRSGGIRATHSPQGDRNRRPMA